MIKNIQVLDCTLRDGGLGLEDLAKHSPRERGISQDSINQIIDHFAKSNVEIVELGSIEISEEDKTRFAIYQDIESISKKIPQYRTGEQLYAALYRGPDTPIENIPEWNENLCEIVRVIIRYSELKKSLDFCAALCKKGYKVFVQPMLTMRYSEEEIDYLLERTNEMNAYALYFVDSYGYMQHSDVEFFFNRFDKVLKPEISIGFHSHNNMNLAYANVLVLLDRETDRRIIIDSCAIGMGQGAGNLQTELITAYLNEYAGKRYNLDSIFDVCEEVEKYTSVGKWGYSVTRMIPAINKTAYKYAVTLREKYAFSYSQINDVLKNIPEELRQRYTLENTEKLVQMYTEGK